MNKLKYIDALRGIAVLAVILIHAGSYGNVPLSPTIDSLVREGARGVQLFYLASAFTLFLSFKNRFSKEAFPIRNFFIRRFFRIAPMYYIGICYYILQNGFGAIFAPENPNITPLGITTNVLFLHSFSPYWLNSIVPGGWSIGVEMMFYAIVPLLFFKIKNLNHAFNFLLLSLVFSVLFRVILENSYTIDEKSLWYDYLFLCFPNQLPIFALGIMMYFIVCEDKSQHKISPISLLLAASMIFMAQIGLRVPILAHLMLPNHFVFGIAFFILAIGLSKIEIKIIVNVITIYIGKISFSMYLVHFAVLHILSMNNYIDYHTNSILNLIIKYMVVVLISAAFSTLFYRMIEVPFQNFGQRLITKLEK